MSAASTRYPMTLRLHRAALLAGMAAATTMIWTGGPGHTPWLRSLSGERVTRETQLAAVGAPERVLVACVVVAVLAFEVWFFFLSGSSLPQG